MFAALFEVSHVKKKKREKKAKQAQSMCLIWRLTRLRMAGAGVT